MEIVKLYLQELFDSTRSSCKLHWRRRQQPTYSIDFFGSSQWQMQGNREEQKGLNKKDIERGCADKGLTPRYLFEQDDYYRSITASHSKKRLLKTLTKEMPTLLSGVKFKHIPDDTLCTRLLHMEDRLLVKSYKFGVVYCKEGQTTDDEMLNNGSYEHPHTARKKAVIRSLF